MEFVIVGGGIGGLAAALALADTGNQVVVLEQAAEFAEIGAGIQLAPNALRVLAALGLDGELAESAVFPKRGVMMDALTGERITAIDFGPMFRQRYGFPYVVMHRSDLLDLLLGACRAHPSIALRPGSKVVDLVDDGRRVLVSCADGSAHEAGALVGADGLWSAVRRHIVGDGDPVVCGDVAYRGTVPIDAVSEHAGIDNVVWWVGPAMHLMQYPVRSGELFNQVAVFTSDRAQPGRDDWGTVDELESRFAGADPHVVAGVELINRDRRWILQDREPVVAWTKGRMTLLGDAAHPMLQYMAQGACQALEDAVCLAECVRANRTDIEQAFTEYQGQRAPRTAAVQRWARRMGEIVHIAGTGAFLRDALLSQRADDDYAYFDWLYAERT